MNRGGIGLVSGALFLLSSLGWADTHEDLVHATAHIGASYAIQTVLYGVNFQGLGLDKTQSEGLALVEALMIGLAYKALEGAGTEDTLRALGEDAVGAGLAIGTHVTFRF